ncbi:MAG: FapA family protein, partial [Phycisphaerae bacterium]
IEGSVQDLFVVRSKQAVTVQGQVGASTLEANGDIVVEGGIAGKDKAKLRTGGKLSAKFCDAATVRASDDVVILKEVINSKIHTDGRLRIMRGALIGGCVHARNGIEVRTLGSSAGVKTTVSVGMDPRLCQQIAKLDLQISKRREAAERVRALVKPLLPELKGLAGWQRQRASQLLGEVRQLDRAVRELQEQRQQLVDWGRATREPAVTVTSQIHPGVTVIVDGLASTFDQPRKGHVKLVKRCIDNQMELVAVDQLSGSVTVLPSYRYRAERS